MQTNKIYDKIYKQKSFKMVKLKIHFLNFLKRPDSMLNSAFRHQIFVAIIVNIITFSHGIALGWTAPMVRKITSNETPLGFSVTLNEASWMVSITPLGAIIGNLLLCNLLDVVGRKFCLFALVIPHVILWICIYFAPNVEILCAARFIGGFTSGGIFAVLPIFICEIADASIRGVIQAFFTIALNFGILIGYIVSSKVNYFLIPIVVLILPLIYFLMLFYFPETPQHLLHKNKDEAAFNSFKFYKNCQHNTPKLEMSFQELKSAYVNCSMHKKTAIKDFFIKSALKAYASCFVLLILSQLSGLYSFINYMSTIFEISGAPMEPDTCTILMGIVQLIGNLATTIFIDRCGRKLLLIISTAGTILGLLTFGFYTHFKDKLDAEKFSWIPLVLMIFIILIGNIGIVSVIIISIVEILPVKIRSTAFSFVMALYCLLVFCVLKVFPIFMQTFGISITMWSCAAIITFCFIYIIIFLPETKNKSMEKD